jgi:hypothetical protein
LCGATDKKNSGVARGRRHPRLGPGSRRRRPPRHGVRLPRAPPWVWRGGAAVHWGAPRPFRGSPFGERRGKWECGSFSLPPPFVSFARFFLNPSFPSSSPTTNHAPPRRCRDGPPSPGRVCPVSRREGKGGRRGSADVARGGRDDRLLLNGARFSFSARRCQGYTPCHALQRLSNACHGSRGHCRWGSKDSEAALGPPRPSRAEVCGSVISFPA